MLLHYNDEELDIQVNDNSYRYRAIKGENALTLYFSLPQHVEIPVGAWCEFEKETYMLEKPENLKMHNSRNFEYTLVLESSQAKAGKYRFRNPVDRRLKFNLTATPREHLQMFVDNMNMRDSGWTIGQCIVAPEKLLSYSHASCMDALSQLATAFDTEYEFNGKEVSLWKVEYNKDNPLPLSYGRGNGFKPGVGRTNFNNSKPVEVLFVQGGERNIDASKYGNKELLLPKNQTLRYDGNFFEGEVGFDASAAGTYVSDADGVSIQRQDKPLRSKEEASLDLSHISPSYIGTVSKVEVTDQGFCDFFDTTIPESLDFSLPASRYAGETMTVIFQSGALAGKEFEIQQNESRVYGYVHSERRFKVVEQIIDGEPMPKGKFMPAEGDTYAVFGITLPDAYVCDNATKTGASWDMFREAVKYLYENEKPKFTFTGELDGIWAKKDWVNIRGRICLGGYVLFSDPQFQPEGVGIRIVGIKEYINNPHSPEIELSNMIVGSSIMSDLRKIESNEVATDSQHKQGLQFTKRRFRDSQETIAALGEAMEANFSSFSASVNPVAVQTMMALVGDESLQFVFVESLSSTVEVAHQVTYDKAAGRLSVPGGYLQHKTLGITEVSSQREAAAYKTWWLPTIQSAVLTDAGQKYYVYAKVSKTAQTGEFRIESAPVAIEEVEGYYHLLLGILNSEFDGDRSYAPLHGFTEILPGRITTDRIVSSDGDTYFDLKAGEIGGKIVFRSGSSGLDNLPEWQGMQNQVDTAQSLAELAGDAANSANSSTQAASDELAKQLGYEDYATMCDKAEKEKATIIEGGHIKTELIDAYQITARKLDVSNNTGKVTILPETGLQLLKYDGSGTNYTKTAEFNGEEKASLSEIIPENMSNIMISEKIVTPTTTKQTATMALGTVNGSVASPVQVTFPTIWLIESGAGYLKIPKWLTPTPAVSYFTRSVATMYFNGKAVATLDMSHEFKRGIDSEPYYHYVAIGGNVSCMAASAVETITTNVADNVKVTFDYRRVYINWPAGTLEDLQYNVHAKFSENTGSTITSQLLKIGKTVLNASFFGNGLIFSKATDQYVGMMATKNNGTQFEIRSGDAGVKIGSGGIEQRKKEGGWDSSGLLLGLKVGFSGGVRTSFGVKDHSLVTATRIALGTYLITHNIGHEKYVVNAIAINGAWNADRVLHVLECKSHELQIQCTAYNNQGFDTDFFITIFGTMSA